jgi:hypothetical protein
LKEAALALLTKGMVCSNVLLGHLHLDLDFGREIGIGELLSLWTEIESAIGKEQEAKILKDLTAKILKRATLERKSPTG